jgi:glyoxylase-like metal-dependent hydrolase (beta-lactamase superfamily II)
MLPIEWRLLEAGFCKHPEFMMMRGGHWAPAEFPALVAVLEHPREGRLLFDTGYATHFLHATDRLPESMYRAVTPVSFSPQQAVLAQLTPHDSVAHVIVSHFHGDHVGGLRDFPSARLHCSADGLKDLRTRSRLDALSHGLLPALLPADFEARVTHFENQARVALPPELQPFEFGYDILGDASVIAIDLPGHAAGHFGICFSDHHDRLVFLVADAAWSSDAIERNAPPPAFVSGWLGDTQRYRTTLARLHELHKRSPEVQLVPAHCRRWRAGVTQ